MHSCPLQPPGGRGLTQREPLQNSTFDTRALYTEGEVMAVEGQVMWVLACQESHGQRKLPL